MFQQTLNRAALGSRLEYRVAPPLVGRAQRAYALAAVDPLAAMLGANDRFPMHGKETILSALTYIYIYTHTYIHIHTTYRNIVYVYTHTCVSCTI